MNPASPNGITYNPFASHYIPQKAGCLWQPARAQEIEVEQTENPQPVSTSLNGSAEEKRFEFLRSQGLIDSSGIATDTFKKVRLHAITNASKKNINNILDQKIAPQKDLRSIPQFKLDRIIPIFNRLLEKYGQSFPFSFHQDTNSVSFLVQFSIKQLVLVLKQKINIDNGIELIGSGVAAVLGADYYTGMIHSWLKPQQKLTKESPQASDFDFWIQTPSLEKVETEVVSFLLYMIPAISQIAYEDLNDFRTLIKELAFKNLQHIDQKIVTGFSNAVGLDFDITFATSKMTKPFAYCNGLIIGIPNNFRFPREMVPYVTEEINPVQCITDQFIGLLNGPGFHDPGKRVEWILASWTKGRRLFCTPWQEEIVKTYKEVTFHPKDANLSEKQFVKMVETINLFLLMRKMGHIPESTHYFKTFSKALLEHKRHEEEPIYHILLSLFEHFSDPLKGLLYLYQLSLYLLSLKKPLFSVGVAKNGSFECLSLQLQFKNSARTLYFSAPFDQELEPLTYDECACVETWLPHFIGDGELSVDHSLFGHFLQAPPPNDNKLKFFFASEEALFSKESPSYELFFDLHPLAQIIQAPLFAISRINTQLSLKGIIGFDLTERALKEKAPPQAIVMAFIQDAQRLCPLALRRAVEPLVKEIKALFPAHDTELLLAKWFTLAFPTDKDLAFALLRYSDFSEENKCTILKGFNKAVCTKTAKNNIPYYFLYRTACSLDEKLIAEDTLALALLPLNTKIPCFKVALEVAISLHKRKALKKELSEKVFSILEKAVRNDPTIFNHPEIYTLFSEHELQIARANSLEDILEHASSADCPELKAKAISLYIQFFPKLELGSVKERAVTNTAITLLCTIHDTLITNVSELAASTLQQTGHVDIAHADIDVLLWSADDDITVGSKVKTKITKHIKLKSLERWKERFFEIAVDMMHRLLDTEPKNEQEDSARLEIVQTMIGHLVIGNARRRRLLPLFEKMVFSPLSACSPSVYENNVKEAKTIYDQLVDANLFDHLDETTPSQKCLYKTTLITQRTAWGDSQFTIDEKISLFNEVLDFQIRAKQPEALHIMFDVCLNATFLIFGKNDEARIAALTKIIHAALTMPYERVAISSKGDALDPTLTTMISLRTGETDDGREYKRIPLLTALIDCMFDRRGDLQLITYHSKDAAVKGYPIVQMLTDKLIPLCISNNGDRITTDECISLILVLWQRASDYQLFGTEAQYVEILRSCITTPLLQKICTTTSWKELLEDYFDLLVRPPVQSQAISESRLDLFRNFIMELLNSGDKNIFDKGKMLFSAGMGKGLYKRILTQDTELMALYTQRG